MGGHAALDRFLGFPVDISTLGPPAIRSETDPLDLVRALRPGLGDRIQSRSNLTLPGCSMANRAHVAVDGPSLAKPVGLRAGSATTDQRQGEGDQGCELPWVEHGRDAISRFENGRASVAVSNPAFRVAGPTVRHAVQIVASPTRSRTAE